MVPPPSAELAAAFNAETQALELRKNSSERALCRKYASLVKNAPAGYMLELAHELIFGYDHRWQAYELIAGHRGAFKSLDAEKVEQLGQGIDSWWSTIYDFYDNCHRCIRWL
jgi:hypothetical protein